MDQSKIIDTFDTYHGPAWTTCRHAPHSSTLAARGRAQGIRRDRHLILVKHIYKFLLFHSCFISLLHIFTMITYDFVAFYCTNLLTRCTVLVPYFLLFCISENLLQKNSSELDENLRELILQQNKDGVRRATRGATYRPGGG